MKYTTILILTLILTPKSYSQLTKKYWLAGGYGSLYSYTDAFTNFGQPTVTGKLTEVNFATNIGYFPTDKLATGIRTSINSVKSRELNTANSSTKDITFTIGPFVRYYFLQTERQVNLLIDGSYQLGTYSTYAGKGISKTTTVSIGTEIFFNSAVGFELLIGYMSRSKSIDDNLLGFTNKRTGLNLSVGFQFHLTD